MDIGKIKQLIELLEKSDLHKLVVKEKNGIEIHLEKPGVNAPQPVHYAPAPMPAPAPAKAASSAEAPAAPKEEKSGDFIKSPMVGTFYASSSPGAKPFVNIGDRIKEDTVICIVEAMKVMNEVKAGVAGVIKEILLEDGAPVEFGTNIVRVE